MSSDSMELEQPSGRFSPRADHRPNMPEPPPVRLVAVEDVHLPAGAGSEPDLYAFYIGVLQFERDRSMPDLIAYRAENVRLIFDVQEPPVQRDDYRAAMIEVPVLRDAEKKLIELEIEYERQRGVAPGLDQLVLTDPAGNWIAIGEMREFR